MAGYFPGNKLAVIKPVAIVQQYFHLRNDNWLAKFINVGLIFLLNIPDNAANSCFFFVRKKQGFICRVIKKFILFNIFLQGQYSKENRDGSATSIRK